jgi:carbonic anhydrase
MTSPISRREFLSLTGLAASGALLAACAPAAPATPAGPAVYAPATPTLRSPNKLEGDAALARLTAGNIRFVAQHLQFPDQNAERREQVATGQSPFAAVLCCADSRVPPEIIFDQGVGDLFVVRVAGNVLDDPIIGSLEYAVEHLGVSLIVVLGHTKCGAVRAALEAVFLGAEAPKHIDSVVKALEPAIDAGKLLPGDPWLNATTANIHLGAAHLRSSEPILAKAVKAKELTIVGARYDIDSGWVEFLSTPAEEAPQASEAHVTPTARKTVETRATSAARATPTGHAAPEAHATPTAQQTPGEH